MSNQQTVIMVPAKAVRQDLKTETKTIVYMPLATTKNPGVVKIGEGFNISSDGLLSLNLESSWYTDVKNRLDSVINNTIKIGTESGAFATKNTTIVGDRDITIGDNAETRLPVSIAIGAESYSEGVAVGAGSYAALDSLALGHSAKALAGGSVQIGNGSNLYSDTLQFKNFNIVSYDGRLYTNTGSASRPSMKQVAIVEDVEKNSNELLNKANVSDLENYYSKDETYSKQEINKLIVPVQGLTKEIVDVLPETGVDNRLYLTPKIDFEGNDYYDEYLYVNDHWEKVGSTQTSLEGYIKDTDYATPKKAGIIKTTSSLGFFIDSVGTLSIIQATPEHIPLKTNKFNPITPNNLDMAVKVGVTTNSIALTDEEISNAHTWLGIELPTVEEIPDTEVV